MSIIMRARNLEDLKKEIIYPLMCTEKLDGAACEIKGATSTSRNDKPYTSVPHIIEELKIAVGSTLGELHIPGEPFKVSGGAIRGDAPDGRIKLGVYDYITEENKENCYQARMDELEIKLITNKVKHVFIIPYRMLYSMEEIEAFYQEIINSSPLAEGICLRPPNHRYQPGKKSWDMLRKKKEATLDLTVVGFEEALTAKKEPKGMAGRFQISYKGVISGAGPGKTSHKERKELWEQYKAGEFTPRLAEIKYKPDPTYEALREPRFSRWRDDKDEVDA